MPHNVLTLGEIATLTTVLNAACRKCGRRDRLHTARLLRGHKPHKPVPEVIRPMTGAVPIGSDADAG